MIEHRTLVESERCRVVCVQCPWFYYSVEATPDDLRERGRQHGYASKARP